jgi:hypothetical protein
MADSMQQQRNAEGENEMKKEKNHGENILAAIRAKQKPEGPNRREEKCGPITHEEFYAALLSVLAEMSAAAILQIPGVYEVVSEELNNEAIDRAVEMRKFHA